jgi:hypothetical protein
MLPIPPAKLGQQGWSSSNFPMPTSTFSPRKASPRKPNHRVRAEGSWLSNEMPDELINMTAPYVPTSPKRKDQFIKRNDLRPTVQQRIITSNVPNSSKLKEHKHSHLVACHNIPISPRYSNDSIDFDQMINDTDNDANISSFSKRGQFNTIKHIHAKREEVELTLIKMKDTLKRNKIQRKPPIFDLTSHKYIGLEPKFQYLRCSPRSLDMNLYAASHLSMVQEKVNENKNPIHPDHNGNGMKYLYRSLNSKDMIKNAAKWQKDFVHESGAMTWDHMNWRHEPIGGNTEYVGYQVCPECKTIAKKNNSIICRSCGAFDELLDLPNSSSSQFSPRNVRGLDMIDLPMHVKQLDGTTKIGIEGRNEHRYAIGMTKREHHDTWRMNKNLTILRNKWKIAENKVNIRREKEHFRRFRSKPLKKDIGGQHSPRYRNGIDKQHRG